jgi:hypothetical protein
METFLFDYLFKASLFLGVGYLFYHTLLRNETHFMLNRLFLLAMIPISFLLPRLPIHSPFRSLTLNPDFMPVMDTAGADPGQTSPLLSILFTLYWGVALLLILRILFHVYHLYRLAHSQPSQAYDRMVLVKVDTPIPPFSFFNRIFMHLPQGEDPRSIDQIISHEAVHIRQLHSLDILIVELAVALQWFNPFVWFYKKALKETHEYLADREVIAQGFNAEGYRLLLFEQQFGAKLFEFASHLKQSQIKRRMFMMNRMKTAGKAPYKVLLALPLIALLALLLAEPRVILAQGDTLADEVKAKPVAATEKKAADDSVQPSKEEIKDTLKKFEQKEKILKEKFATASSDEEKMKIKQALGELFKKRDYYAESAGVKIKMQKDDDTPVTPDMLKKKLQKSSEILAKMKTMLAQETDEAKQQELKMKISDLEKFQKEAQLKLESLEKKNT